MHEVTTAKPVSSGPDILPSLGAEDDSIATTLRKMRSSLSKSELKVAAALLSNYPVAGLVNISSLARKAGVSDPTVTRLVTKLGFDGFGSFKASLQSELEQRLIPVSKVDPLGVVSGMETLSSAAKFFSVEISRSFMSVSNDDVETALDLLADQNKRIFVTGGKVSGAIARIFGWSLEVLRPQVQMVDSSPAERLNALLDIGDDALVVAFDYRRYEADTLAFIRRAHELHAKTVLFTDPYLSPASGYADVVLYASIAGLTPFNSMATSLALVEALLSMVIPRLGDDASHRVQRYVELSDDLDGFAL